MQRLLAVLFLIATGSWYSFAAPDGSFRVEFPDGRPSRQSRSGRTDYWRFDGSTTYRVQVFTKKDYAAAKAEELLRNYPNPQAAGIDGKVVNARPLEMGRYSGRAVRIEGSATQEAHAYVTDGRLYLVSATSAPGKPLSPDADRFFESFAILK